MFTRVLRPHRFAAAVTVLGAIGLAGAAPVHAQQTPHGKHGSHALHAVQGQHQLHLRRALHGVHELHLKQALGSAVQRFMTWTS